VSGGQQPIEYSTKIGGGRSAWLIALAALLAVVGFVAIAVSGREQPPVFSVATAEPSRAAASSAASSAAPDPAPATPSAVPAAAVEQIRPSTSGPLPERFLGTVLELGGEEYLAELQEVAPGHFYAAYRIDFPRPARTATLGLAEIAPKMSSGTWHSLGEWQIDLAPMTPETRRAGRVLDAVELPQLTPAGPELGRSGFQITVYAEGRLNFGLLTIDVRRGAERPYPNESYAVDVRAGAFATRVTLTGFEAGRFSGTLVIPDRVAARQVRLTLVAMPAQNPLLGMVVVHEFSTELHAPNDFETGHSFFSVSPARAREPGLPELLTFSHEFSAETVYSGLERAMVLHLHIPGGGPTR
jgi:hypothetical protein